MGHYVYTDIVPYIKRYVIETDSPYDGPEVLCKLLIPDSFMELECNFQTDNDIPDLKARGWEGHTGEYVSFGNNGRTVVGKLWVKDNIGTKVYLVNESQFSNVGEHNLSIVGKTKKDIISFCNDFSDLLNNKFSIEGPSAIVHWWA